MRYNSAPGGFHSYAHLLQKYIQRVPEDSNILEWGPGESTKLMLKKRGGANYEIYEHDPYWCEEAEWLNEYNNVNLHCLSLDENYTDHVLGLDKKFDLIFIDGTERVKCCKTAQMVLKPNGYVLIHDINYKQHKTCKEYFEVIEEDSDTVVMMLNE